MNIFQVQMVARKTFFMTWCKAPSPSFHLAFLSWELLSSTEVKGSELFWKELCLPPSTEASSYWLSLSPSSSTCRRGSLLRPPASWSVPWDLHSDFLQLAFPFLILAQLLLTCAVHIQQSELTWIYSMFLLSLVLRRSPCWEQAVTSCPNAPMPRTTRTKRICEDQEVIQ